MKLVSPTDPILHQACDFVEANEDLRWIDNLRDICTRTSGAGVAAPQIGIKKSLAYIQRGNFFIVNPFIEDASSKTTTGQEGCLSYPGIFVPVTRPEVIRIRYLPIILENNEYKLSYFKTQTFEGLVARVIQHEMDHMNGICHVGDAWRHLQTLPMRSKLALATSRVRF